MAKYKVNVIAICVKNNRIAKFDEVVDSSELTVSAEELINTGSIKLITDDAETTEEAPKGKGKGKAKTAAEKVAQATTEVVEETPSPEVVDETE